VRNHICSCVTVFLVGAMCVGSVVVAAEQPQASRPFSFRRDVVATMMGKAQDHLKQGNLAEAERISRLLVDADPEAGEAHAILGAALYGQGKIDDAVIACEHGLEVAGNDPKIAFVLARCYLARDENSKAVRMMRIVAAAEPEGDHVQDWLGAAYLADKQFLAAYRAFRRSEPQTEERRQSIELQKAVALARMGWTGHAANRFEALQTLEPRNPTIELADQMLQQLDGMEQDRKDKPWDALIRIGLRYDDNPAVVPTTNVFGLAGLDDESAGAGITARFNYQLYSSDKQQVTASYSFFQTLYFEADDSDVQNHRLSVSASHRDIWGDLPWQAGLTIGGGYTLINNDSFLGQLDVTPSLTLVLTDWTSTTVYVGYQALNFLGQAALDGTARDRDSDDLSLGVTQQFQLPWNDIVMSLGYRYNMNWADGADFDNRGHRLQWSVTSPLPVLDMSLTLVGYVTFRDYDHVDTIATVRRDDEEYGLSVVLALPIQEQVTVLFEYNLTRNDSNIATNDYERNVYQVGVEFRF